MRRTYEHLRLADAVCLRAYQENTQLWMEIGNVAFAKHVLEVGEADPDRDDDDTTSNIVCELYHAWIPQMMHLTAEQTDVVRGLMNSTPEIPLTTEQQRLSNALAELNWLDDVPVDIDELVGRAFDRVIAIQNRYELTEYLKRVAEKQPRVVIEIGTARGGMLYSFSQLATADATLVSIDLPGAPNCGGQTEVERDFFKSFIRPGQNMHFIPANSLFSTTRETLRSILGECKADILFIDGDHSYGGVRSDFEMYREFVAPGGLITFHDICLKPEQWGPGNEVGVFWDEIAAKHDVIEIVDPAGSSDPNPSDGINPRYGIGILNPAAAGRITDECRA